jgi:hypothetical protein
VKARPAALTPLRPSGKVKLSEAATQKIARGVRKKRQALVKMEAQRHQACPAPARTPSILPNGAFSPTTSSILPT